MALLRAPGMCQNPPENNSTCIRRIDVRDGYLSAGQDYFGDRCSSRSDPASRAQQTGKSVAALPCTLNDVKRRGREKTVAAYFMAGSPDDEIYRRDRPLTFTSLMTVESSYGHVSYSVDLNTAQ